MTPELSLAYADVARLERRVRELEAALENMCASFRLACAMAGHTTETGAIHLAAARAALAKREGG